MIIKPRPFPIFIVNIALAIFTWFLRRRFNKMIIRQIAIKPNHSYLLMCNHFSFWDGFWAYYLAFCGIHQQQGVKGYFVMSLKKQMKKNFWLRYIGAFSVVPTSRTVSQSFDFAAELLSKPGNVLLFYPQANLESSHIRHIEFKDGIVEIVKRIKGDCQLLWSSNIPEYFESLKASVYFNMLDCGTNHDFDFEALKQKVNAHHLTSLQKNIRYTQEPEQGISLGAKRF